MKRAIPAACKFPFLQRGGARCNAADGNLTDDGAYTYEWDALSRLMALEEKGTAAGRKRLEFAYNALNQRVRITAKTYTNGAWVVDEENSAAFVWMDTSIAQKRTLDGETVVRNYYPQGFTAHGVDANDQPTITKYFYTKDHLGSIREVVGNDGATVHARIDYDAWGNITSETNGAGNAAAMFSDFSYTGHFRHAYAPHLVFAMYRAYAPDLGRWISRDPIAEAGGVNLYGYVGNRPVNEIDNLGLANSNYAGRGTNPTERNLIDNSSKWTLLGVFNAANAAEDAVANSGYKGLHNGPADALRHCVWSCEMTRRNGKKSAKQFGDAHEADDGPADEKAMDCHNNEQGRKLGEDKKTRKQSCESLCKKAFISGSLKVLDRSRWNF